MRRNKIIVMLLIFIISFTLIDLKSYAKTFEIKSPSLSELVKGDEFNPNNENAKMPVTVTNLVKRALGAISIIGAILTVILIAVIGFQYITGSSQDIAEIKSRFGRNINRCSFYDSSFFYSKTDYGYNVREVII